jgi:hypothetical protein
MKMGTRGTARMDENEGKVGGKRRDEGKRVGQDTSTSIL